jgi:threonine dehydrogenase-like Zn-dependent dehydrogenase
MGHEAAGTVLEVGSAVRGFRRGERVALPFSTCCGACAFCNEGLTSRCTKGELFGWVQEGKGLQGLQAERARVPLADATLVRLPDDITFEQGALLGDIVPTGAFCADQAGARPGAHVVVIGCGPVGMMAVLAAQAQGARRLWAIDVIPERLALCASFGAEPIDARAGDPATIVQEATEGRGADAVIEVAGSYAAARLAFDLARVGGTIASIGVHAPGEVPGFTAAEAYAKNLTYRSGRCPARRYMDRLLPHIGREGSRLASIVSHRLALSDGVAAYAMFEEKRAGCTKVVLTP